MTAPRSIDSAHFLHGRRAQASPDLLWQMLTTFINTLMSAEAERCVAPTTASAGTREPTSATATGAGSSTPVPAH